MFFKSKPNLYLQFLDQSIRYLAVNTKNKSLVDQGEIVLDTQILSNGEIVNYSLIKNRLAHLVKEKKWKNAKAHILLPNKYILLREEWIPAQLVREEIKDYLSLHMGESIRIPYEYPVFDFQVIERNEEEQKIFMLAYPAEKVKEYQKLLDEASLKARVADLNTLGLYRIAEKENKINIQKHTLILEWNPYEMALMVYFNNQPTFFRQSQSPELSDSFEQSVNGEWSWRESKAELEDTIMDQLDGLERFLDFYNYSVGDGESNVGEIILTGYHPTMDKIRRLLMERFSIPVSTLETPVEIRDSFDALYGLTLKEEKRNKKTRKSSRKKSRKKKRGRSK